MATQNILFAFTKPLSTLFVLALMMVCAASTASLGEETPASAAAAAAAAAAESPVLPGTGTTPPLVGPAAPVAAATGPAAGAAAAGSAAVGAAAAAGSAAAGAAAGDLHPLTFFMHDIIGGSNPTAVAVTGIVASPTLSAQVPFAKPNGANLAINTGIPQDNGNNGILNNNNVPFLSGLNGVPGNVIQNNGVNLIGGGSGFPILNGGNLPQGMTLQKLMFGTLTVFDDELTEGVELNSGLVGKAQGYYVASSEDGTSQTMALTAMFVEDGYVDSISFFGVHRTVVSESQLAIMGGTGKYVNARGYATIKTLPVTQQQQNIDGSETLVEFNVYLA